MSDQPVRSGHFYIGVEPPSQPGECTTVSVTEYTLDPRQLYRVRYLERFPAGAPYTAIIEVIQQIRAELGGGLVVLNGTYVGDPIKDMFKRAGLLPVSIQISTTETAIRPHVENAVDPLRKYDRLFWKVPYLDIVSVLQVAFQQDELQIAPDMDLAQSLADEILSFRLTVSPTGKIDRLRVDANADLFLSVAIAVYVAARFGGPTIPIENLTTENVGTPDILDDDARRMPTVWNEKEQMNTAPRTGLKYKWAQPGKTPQAGSNLPGLM